MLSSSMDRSVDPCQDFYRFACGGWIAANKIPEDSASISVISKIKKDVSLKMRSQYRHVIVENLTKKNY